MADRVVKKYREQFLALCYCEDQGKDAQNLRTQLETMFKAFNATQVFQAHKLIADINRDRKNRRLHVVTV